MLCATAPVNPFHILLGRNVETDVEGVHEDPRRGAPCAHGRDQWTCGAPLERPWISPVADMGSPRTRPWIFPGADMGSPQSRTQVPTTGSARCWCPLPPRASAKRDESPSEMAEGSLIAGVDGPHGVARHKHHAPTLCRRRPPERHPAHHRLGEGSLGEHRRLMHNEVPSSGHWGERAAGPGHAGDCTGPTGRSLGSSWTTRTAARIVGNKRAAAQMTTSIPTCAALHAASRCPMNPSPP